MITLYQEQNTCKKKEHKKCILFWRKVAESMKVSSYQGHERSYKGNIKEENGAVTLEKGINNLKYVLPFFLS